MNIILWYVRDYFQSKFWKPFCFINFLDIDIKLLLIWKQLINKKLEYLD